MLYFLFQKLDSVALKNKLNWVHFSSSAGCLRPSAAAAWRKSPPRSSWCALWSASTTWTASAAACATGSWGRATSLSWRRASCCARSTTRGRRTYSARSARMTQTQVSAPSLAHPLARGWETTPWCYHHMALGCCILYGLFHLSGSQHPP